MTELYFSESRAPASWSEATLARERYGPKGAGLMPIPRAWTLPFILVSAEDTHTLLDPAEVEQSFVKKLVVAAGSAKKIIVRSSVIGETIWDRGKYKSITVDLSEDQWLPRFQAACAEVIASAGGQPCALVLQQFLEPKQRGEFGNLLRISKTRDQWELITHGHDSLSTSRLNTQRDAAVPEATVLAPKPRLPAERLFGSIAAWFNNVLTRGQSARLNIEWIGDNARFYLVQVDEEDPDLAGVNPLQIAVTPMHKSGGNSGRFIQLASAAAIERWDKLRVLKELWSAPDSDKPNLFYIPLDRLPNSDDYDGSLELTGEFERLLGPDNIVVRTSLQRGQKKAVNLPRTDCLTPSRAAAWCLAKRDELAKNGTEHLQQLAFIAHRYMDARASAWARAAPDDPTVEIHGLWGLPDALQYCPYDIWEVHVPTGTAVEYPEYKSNILRSQSDGSWTYARVKNEVARSLSISRKEAIEIANRTREIATRLGVACHVMWFVGCQDESGRALNMPWYWTEAHPSAANHDRARHLAFVVTNRHSLVELSRSNIDKTQHMIVLRPDHQDLFRDNDFLREVASQALAHEMPIDLEGSTLAHAYYQLIEAGCIVIASSEKDHSRTRKNIPFGKLVRDKIPERIAARQELGATKTVPRGTLQSFLIGKVLEEALEVRESTTVEERKIELADLVEIVRALGALEGLTLEEIIAAANRKREKLGGFESGKVLLQTGIGGPGQTAISPSPNSAQVLSRNVGPDVAELPFTFFGFSELDQARSVRFPDLGVSLEVTLKNDRLSLRLVREPEQLELPMSLEISSS